MQAMFIISLDCEGKWGIADHIDDYYNKILTNQTITETYRKLLEHFNRWEIKATFAFVGAFSLSVDEYQEHRDCFVNYVIQGKSWLEPFHNDISKNCYDGWLNPEAFKLVDREPQHEISPHGFTHVPSGEKSISRQDFCQELLALKKITSFKNRTGMTYIYPRNQIGYLDELEKAGYVGYRDILIKPRFSHPLLEKMRWFANELNLYSSAQSQSKFNYGSIICIPSGYIINHRFGIREKIPISLTIKRWRNIIDDAVKNNKVVHLYTHPHNFITGDNMFYLLDNILSMIYNSMRRNEIKNVTQKEYCETLMNQNEWNYVGNVCSI